MKTYVEQTHWDSGYQEMDLDRINKLADDDKILQWINSYIEPVYNRTCFEIGCFPGRYLNIFGEKGYVVNGIDLTPRVQKDLPEWFQKNGIQTGEFRIQNISDLDNSNKYDLVFSIGFIEHFSHWKELVQKHARVSNEYVVIATPNFRGILQRFIHYFFDRENYKRHNINSMKPKIWSKILQQEGFDIIFYGSIGKFDFWVEKNDLSNFQHRLLRIIRYQIGKYLSRLKPNKYISPYLGVMARKRKV